MPADRSGDGRHGHDFIVLVAVRSHRTVAAQSRRRLGSHVAADLHDPRRCAGRGKAGPGAALRFRIEPFQPRRHAGDVRLDAAAVSDPGPSRAVEGSVSTVFTVSNFLTVACIIDGSVPSGNSNVLPSANCAVIVIL